MIAGGIYGSLHPNMNKAATITDKGNNESGVFKFFIIYQNDGFDVVPPDKVQSTHSEGAAQRAVCVIYKGI